MCRRIRYDPGNSAYPLTELSGNCLLILFGSYRNNTKLFRERDTLLEREYNRTAAMMSEMSRRTMSVAAKEAGDTRDFTENTHSTS